MTEGCLQARILTYPWNGTNTKTGEGNSIRIDSRIKELLMMDAPMFAVYFSMNTM